MNWKNKIDRLREKLFKEVTLQPGEENNELPPSTHRDLWTIDYEKNVSDEDKDKLIENIKERHKIRDINEAT